jgi:DNA-binding transcriptional regulator YiaG
MLVFIMTPKELIEWRKQHGLTQMALADYLSVTRACVCRWESGKRTIPAFLHLALKCLKVKKGGESRGKGKKTKKERKVKK